MTRMWKNWRFAVLAVLAALYAAPAKAEWTSEAEACYQAGDSPAGGIVLCSEAIDTPGLDQANLAITYSNRGNSFFDLGQFDRAVTDYDVALELQPDDSVTLSNRGAALIELELYERALMDLNQAIILRGDNAVALTNRCWVYAIQEHFELARLDCDDAIDIEPLDPIALASRAFVLMQLGDQAAAAEDADLAVQFGPQYWETHFYRGLAYEMGGNLREASLSYERAVALAPQEPRIQEKLAEMGAR